MLQWLSSNLQPFSLLPSISLPIDTLHLPANTTIISILQYLFPWYYFHPYLGHWVTAGKDISIRFQVEEPEDVAQCKWSFLTVHQFEQSLHGTSTATVCSVGLQQVSGEIFSIIYLGSRTVDTCEKYNQHLYHNNSTRLRKWCKVM